MKDGSGSKIKSKLSGLYNIDRLKKNNGIETKIRNKSEQRDAIDIERYIDPSLLERKIMEMRASQKRNTKPQEGKPVSESCKK